MKREFNRVQVLALGLPQPKGRLGHSEQTDGIIASEMVNARHSGATCGGS